MEDDRWESLEVAAKRLGRNKGHLRKLCPAWARQGKARKMRGGGRRSRWQVRRDAKLPNVPIESAPIELAGMPVMLTVGGVSATISGDFSMNVRSTQKTSR